MVDIEKKQAFEEEEILPLTFKRGGKDNLASYTVLTNILIRLSWKEMLL